jgi:hypothetical protein
MSLGSLFRHFFLIVLPMNFLSAVLGMEPRTSQMIGKALSPSYLLSPAPPHEILIP